MMAETELTKQIKRELFYHTNANKQGMYGCYEVTLGGGYGKERVDFMTMDCYDTFRCYEIKVSLSDLNSNCMLSFGGDYNYFVVTDELLDSVKSKINLDGKYRNVGILVFHTNNNCFSVERKSKKCHVPLSDKVDLMHCMIRSLSRLTIGGDKE